MNLNKKIRDYGFNLGTNQTGINNSITDVPGVKVGHKTLDNGNIKTGVTVIMPHGGNMFKEKLIAASHVINGFGKSLGLIQIDELGTIETPIVLTNTLNVGIAHEAIVRYMLDSNNDIGTSTGSVNPIVGECNDGELNDIRGLHVTKEDVFEAIENCDIEFLEGNVGAATGMICYDLKGGIGSSSRIVKLGQTDFTVGVLVLSNFGSLEDFVLKGDPIGQRIKSILPDNKTTEDKGSIVSILATDIPLSSSQLKRVIKRIQSGIARTGSYTGHSSGEVCVGFSTANKINHYEAKEIFSINILNDDHINKIFKATVEATEEAVLNSMVCSTTTIGRDNKKVYSLKDFI